MKNNMKKYIFVGIILIAPFASSSVPWMRLWDHQVSLTSCGSSGGRWSGMLPSSVVICLGQLKESKRPIIVVKSPGAKREIAEVQIKGKRLIGVPEYGQKVVRMDLKSTSSQDKHGEATMEVLWDRGFRFANIRGILPSGRAFAASIPLKELHQ
jgi:hypothetical protein